jgi:Spy/CpxP family protein refolding chaperone
MRKTLIACALALATTAVFAQGYGRGPGYGYGPGMMGGGGPGYGQGMMSGGGWGPGMMGPGTGPGAGGGLAALNLSDEQREKVFAIREEARKKNWATMGEVRSEQFKLRGMYSAERLDPDKIAEQQKKVDELRRQMVKSRADTHNKVMAVLTPEQRKQAREYGPWWATEEE